MYDDCVMATAQELLNQVETAITQCLTAQIYTIAGRTKQMAQLESLRKFRQELKDEVEAGSNSGGMSSLGQICEVRG